MTIDRLTSLKQHLLAQDGPAGFMLFLVDREVVTPTTCVTRLSVCDIVKDVVRETNQRTLYGRPKVKPLHSPYISLLLASTQSLYLYC